MHDAIGALCFVLFTWTLVVLAIYVVALLTMYRALDQNIRIEKIALQEEHTLQIVYMHR